VPVIQAYSAAEDTRMVEKTIELTGTSTNSIEDAVGLAVARAAATIKGIKPEVEVDRITCVVEDGGALLGQYNIHFVAETCHLMIADATGKSVVVEFIDGQIKPTVTHENWQVCTNHQLCNKTEAENDKNCNRYQLASGELSRKHRIIPRRRPGLFFPLR
jgi:flavin-binding protein dodecin